MTSKIPLTPPGLPPQQSRQLEAIRESIEIGEGTRGNPLLKKLTIKDLITLQMLQLKDGFTLNSLPRGSIGGLSPITPTTEIDLTPPPAPAGFTVSGAISHIVLQWDWATYSNPAYTEVWRHSTDNIAEAVRIGTSDTAFYSDSVDPGTSYYYWVRHVSTADVVGPYNDSLGTLGTSGQDPTKMLEMLQDELDESHLVATLNTRLNKIEGNEAQIGVHTTDITGLEAQYVIKTDVNGNVAGYGLANYGPLETGAESEFVVLADRFAVLHPDADSGTGKLAFAVEGSNTVMDGAYIKTATINDAQIGSVTVDKITGDTANFVSANIGAGTIGSLEIANTLQSTDYSPGVDGWKLYKDVGSLELNGSLITRAITVYDSSGNVIMSSGTGTEWQYVSGSGKPADNATVGATWGSNITGEPTSLDDINSSEFNVIASQNSDSFISGNLIHNGNMTLVAPDGRPLGVKAGENAGGKFDVSYQDSTNQVLKLYRAGDDKIGCVFPAFPVNPSTKYRVLVRARVATTNASLGFFVRFDELDADLDEGMTHTCHATSAPDETGIQARTRTVDTSPSLTNVAITTTFQTFDAIYTPTSTARYASLAIMNWEGIGTQSLLIDRVVVYPLADRTSDNPQGASWLTDDVVGDHNPITSTNITTYMSGAAIDYAQIKDAAIRAAHILDAEVGTLKLAGQAVHHSVSTNRSTDWDLPDSGWNEIMSVPITTSGAPIQIHIAVSGDAWCTESGGKYEEIDLRITRDGGQIKYYGYVHRVHVGNDGDKFSLALVYKDDSASAGAHTYKLEGHSNKNTSLNNSGVTIKHGGMIIHEVKKA